jgi:3-hydroxy-9,10-secoandrosta-1,3,5(10)-triene-9,17-dione monooxygenase
MTITLSPDVDRDLVARATDLVPLLAAHAERTEAERQVVPEVMGAMEEAGLFEVIVPERRGGLGATMATQLAVAAELGRGCASSAWVQTLLNITTWAASRSPSADVLWSDGPRPRVCGVLAPSGTATPEGDGYRVSGKWAFGSGSFYANWFVGGALVVDDAGDVTGAGIVAVPRDDFAIEDTWFVAGMCGTASGTVVVDDVVVPGELFTPLEEADQSVGDAPSDRWPLGTALSLVLTGPLLGAGRASADLVSEKAPGRAISYTGYGETTESMVAISELARAQLDIDTAWMHAFDAAAYLDGVGRGAARDRLAAAKVRGQCGYLTSSLRRGVDTLLNVAGAGSFASASALQRHWRDINVGSRHAFLATDVSLETYGRGLFGLDPIVMIL